MISRKGVKKMKNLSKKIATFVATVVFAFTSVVGSAFAAVPVPDPATVNATTDITTGISQTYFQAWAAVLIVIGGIIVTGMFIRFVIRKVRGAAH